MSQIKKLLSITEESYVSREEDRDVKFSCDLLMEQYIFYVVSE